MTPLALRIFETLYVRTLGPNAFEALNDVTHSHIKEERADFNFFWPKCILAKHFLQSKFESLPLMCKCVICFLEMYLVVNIEKDM